MSAVRTAGGLCINFELLRSDPCWPARNLGRLQIIRGLHQQGQRRSRPEQTRLGLNHRESATRGLYGGDFKLQARGLTEQRDRSDCNERRSGYPRRRI